MDLSQLNYLAVLAAAISMFLLGGLWYSPRLFGKAWMRANGFTDEDLKRGNVAKIFSLSFLLAFVAAFDLAVFLSGEGTDVGWGVVAGALAGVGWVAVAIGIIGLFERRGLSYIAINAGYMIVAFIVMGAILGAWR